MIEDWWAEYRKKIVPTNASKSMEAEARKAFYAGVGCMFGKVVEAAEGPSKASEKLFDVLSVELTAFADEQLSDGND